MFKKCVSFVHLTAVWSRPARLQSVQNRIRNPRSAGLGRGDPTADGAGEHLVELGLRAIRTLHARKDLRRDPIDIQMAEVDFRTGVSEDHQEIDSRLLC